MELSAWASFARAERVAGVHQFSEFPPRQNLHSIVVKLPKRILDKMSIEDRVCHRTMTVQRLQKNCEGRVCHRTMIVTNCTKKLRAHKILDNQFVQVYRISTPTKLTFNCVDTGADDS